MGRRGARQTGPWKTCLGLLAVLLLAGCQNTSFGPDYSIADNFRYFQMARLVMKQEHRKLIEIYQGRLDRHEEVKTFQLYGLANAYYEVRDYQNLFATLELMDHQIAQGDKMVPEGMKAGTDLSCATGMFRGAAWLDLGEPARAEQTLDQAYAVMLRTLGDQPTHDQATQSPLDVALHLMLPGYLGVAHAVQGHGPEAKKCITLLKNTIVGANFMEPYKRISLARLYLANKQYDQSLAVLQAPAGKLVGIPALLESTMVSSAFQDLPQAYILAKALYETGDLEHARQGFDQLLEHPRIREVGGIHWPILLDRARIARQDGQLPLAEKLLKEGVEVVERQRASIHTETGRIGFVADKQSLYQELVALLVDRGRAAEAFDYVERAKGRALVDLLASQKQLATPAAGRERLLAAMAGLDQAERDDRILAEPGAGRGIALKLRKEIGAAPELASLVLVTRTPVPELQARIGADETLLEYFAAGADWYAFVVRRDGIRATRLPAEHLEQAVDAARQAFTHPDSTDSQAAAANLYRQLVEPVSGQLRNHRLTIVPHGVLHYVPFAALGGGDQCLLDRFSLRVLPSAGVLNFLKGKKAVKRALVLGNPDLGDPALDLAFAQDEALSVARILPQATVLLRGQATAAVVRAQGSQFDVLHFAAHGYFDVNKPLDSALLLAKDGDSSGTLRVSELYRLSLDADLVTLSACETALSQVANGDDLVGFTRGLLYAGSRSILSSLWKVDDQATRDLMVAFYRGLDPGPKGEALRRAQLEMRKQHPHPFYWAGFVLTGNDR